MILDITTLLSANQVITATAPSTNVYDTAGVGVGVPVPNIFGTATIFGNDIGIGDGMSPPNLLCVVGTAFTAAGAGTLQVQLQAAVDTGTNTGIPGTWDTIVETDALPLSVLTAGRQIAEFAVPPRYPGQGFPRFYRLNYVVASGPMTAGSISTSALITGRDDNPLYPGNF